MSGFLNSLGKRVAPAYLKTRWIYRSLTGTESERIEAEHSLGAYLTYVHTRGAKLERDPEIAGWLKSLTDRLALALVNRERRFQVRCLAEGDPNAFALPGGFLFVSRSLLDLCDFDRDEIAFVLAHEMGHVIRSHSVNRIVTSELARLLSRGAPATGALKPVLSRLIHQLVTQGYSRRQEFEADRVAVRITRVCGYDTGASARLFERLRATAKDPGAIAAYLSSHPPFASRIESIERALRQG